MHLIDRVVSNPLGALAVLALAALLEAFGDSFFQAGFYRFSGTGRVLALVAGAGILTAYGSVVMCRAGTSVSCLACTSCCFS